MQGDPAAAETSVKLQQREAQRVFSRGSCAWIMVHWQWRAVQAPRRRGVVVACACTQGSCWLQQQP